MIRYVVYGLDIASSHPIPGLIPCQSDRPPDVEVVWGTLPDEVRHARRRERVFPVDARDRDQRSELTAWRVPRERHVVLSYSDGIEFAVDSNGTRVWITWPDGLTTEDAAVNLLGPALGFLLRLRGVLCLHASAVAHWDCGLALVGPAGAGKSTLAAAFAESGHALLSDDVLPLVRNIAAYDVQPGYPRVRLWSDSVRALFGAPDALPLLSPNWDKRRLDLTGPRHRFHQGPVPLRALYLLDSRTTELRSPAIEAATRREAFMFLVTNTYANYLLDARMKTTEFTQLHALVSAVPVRRVRSTSNYAQLMTLRAAIVDDFEATIGKADGDVSATRLAAS